MKFDKDTVTLSTGRSFYAYSGNLHPEARGELTYGFDGCVELDEEPLTPDERKEIAEVMIGRWKNWAETGDPK